MMATWGISECVEDDPSSMVRWTCNFSYEGTAKDRC